MSSPIASYSYDQGVAAANPIGRRTGMADAAGSESWTYDVMGRIATDQRTTGGVSKTTTYAPYNLDGSIAAITYPSGDVFAYTPSGAARPVSVSDTTQGINYITAAHYAPHGALASLTSGANLFSTYIYNSRLQLCWSYTTTATALPWNTATCTTSATAGTIFDSQYNLNLGAGDNGNVVGIINNVNTDRSLNFAYDSLNRLTSAETTSTFSTDPTRCWGETYQYDNQSTGGAWGNLSGITAIEGAYMGCAQESGLSATILTNNQFSPASGYGYDAAGNLTSTAAPPASYTYDAENHLVAAGGVTYTYDGDGKRVEKSTGKLYWYDTSGNVISELNASGTVTDSYIFFAGHRVVHRSSTAGIFYNFQDDLGTSRVVVASGQSSRCYDAEFYPFGGERAYNNTCGLTYKFTGKERDPESNLDDFGARYYASALGRFVSADWSGIPEAVPYANLNNPQTLNLYAIVKDNPETFADLDGHWYIGDDNPDQPGASSPPLAQFGVTPGIMYVTVTTTSTTSTTDNNGVTTSTKTTLTAYFGAQGDNAGKYSGTITRSETVRSDDPKNPSSKTTFAQQDSKSLISTFGGINVINAQQGAVGYASSGALLNPKLTLRDVKNIVVGGALGFCLGAEPCGAVAAGAGLVEGAYELHESIKDPSH